jgi:hypothetical protein
VQRDVAHGDGERRSRSRTVERLREREPRVRESPVRLRGSSDRLTATRVGGAQVHDGGSGGARTAAQVWPSGFVWVSPYLAL